MDRFLLYIDLLGFSELVHTKPKILPDLFRVLDKSNAHQHGDFRVIQFSDTLLIFNAVEAVSNEDKSYYAMYLCEFAEEIQCMLLGRDTFLRGLLTYGQFEDTGPAPNSNYRKIRAFWGESLIAAYNAEKNIQAVGLFVDKTVKPHMNIFKTHLYDQERAIWFVDTATGLRDCLLEGEGTDFSHVGEYIIETDGESLLAYDLLYLKRLFEHGHDTSLPPSVRMKYQTTWEIYRQKYKGLCKALEDAKFDFQKVIAIDWKPFIDRIGTPDGFFG